MLGVWRVGGPGQYITHHIIWATQIMFYDAALMWDGKLERVKL